MFSYIIVTYNSTMDTLLLILTTLTVITLGNAQTLPVWDIPSPTIVRSEDAPLGDLLFSMSVNGTDIQLELDNEDARQLCNISQTIEGSFALFANVTLAAELDRDFNPDIRYLRFKATVTGAVDARTVTLIITDINDNAPEFLNQPYRATPPENTAVGSAILTGISVFDRDTITQTIVVNLVPDTITSGLFELTQTGNTAEITLKKPLDYEARHIYTITIIATDDGGLNRTTTAQIDVQDVQDTPPFFLFDVYRGAVVENDHANKSVIQVQAEDGDGDRDAKNDITYSIIEGPADLFNIDTTTGVIYATHTMDREDPVVIDVNGVFTLVVQAEELNMTWPQYGNTTATVNVYVTIDDVNDNSPTFNTSHPYTAFVRNDVPDGSLIYFGGDGYMQVYDRDQTGQSATFSLTIEGENSKIFAPSPGEVFSEANVLIRVIDSSAIRSLGGTIVTFNVIAREVDTAESFEGRATVVLSIDQTEEPTTTPAPIVDDLFKAPDIVVFVVGFLVLLNIVTSIVICYMLRGRGQSAKEGLSRHGSKYYIKKRPTNDFTNHGLNNPSTSEMIEVDPEVAVCPREPRNGLTPDTRDWRDKLTSPRF